MQYYQCACPGSSAAGAFNILRSHIFMPESSAAVICIEVTITQCRSIIKSVPELESKDLQAYAPSCYHNPYSEHENTQVNLFSYEATNKYVFRTSMTIFGCNNNRICSIMQMPDNSSRKKLNFFLDGATRMYAGAYCIIKRGKKLRTRIGSYFIVLKSQNWIDDSEVDATTFTSWGSHAPPDR